MADLKRLACAAIDESAGDLHRLSDAIWRHPELGLEERFAHDTLTHFLQERGFQVQKSYGLETAFKASYGDENQRPHVVFCSEYDALPDIGHACGHNLIAEVGVAAGIGVKAAIDAFGTPLGKVTVFGTPAEETIGGKIDLIEHGAFSDVDFAMMCHPSAISDPSPSYLSMECIRVLYHGKAVHATCDPWEGVNALDAAVMCYQGIGNMRLQMKHTWKVNAIIKRGGERTNIIPEETEMEISFRAPTEQEFRHVREKVINCCEGATKATGCKFEYETTERLFKSLLHNSVLVDLYEKNLKTLSVPQEGPSRRCFLDGSSDMGNVTHVVPGIHPHFYIGGQEVYHTRGFTTDSGSDNAQAYTLRQGKALAMTAIDVLCNQDLMASMKAEFNSAKGT